MPGIGSEPDMTGDRPEDAVAVTISWLVMSSPEQFRPARQPAECDPLLLTAGRPAPELSRFFYRLVGGGWSWLDRIEWTAEQWLDWVSQPGHQLTTCWVDGVPAGYFELDQNADEVTLSFFGLAPGFSGRGLGRWLLTEAITSAWSRPGTDRIVLHTCTLDSPAALPNYLARGFTVQRTETEWRAAGASP